MSVNVSVRNTKGFDLENLDTPLVSTLKLKIKELPNGDFTIVTDCLCVGDRKCGKQMNKNNLSYKELSEIVNASYVRTKDIRKV